MAKVKIDKDKCKGCYLCVVNCPRNLIKIAAELNIKGVKPAYFPGGKPARLHGEHKLAGGCTGCSMCAIICPDCAIKIFK